MSKTALEARARQIIDIILAYPSEALKTDLLHATVQLSEIMADVVSNTLKAPLNKDGYSQQELIDHLTSEHLPAILAKHQDADVIELTSDFRQIVQILDEEAVEYMRSVVNDAITRAEGAAAAPAAAQEAPNA